MLFLALKLSSLNRFIDKYRRRMLTYKFQYYHKVMLGICLNADIEEACFLDLNDRSLFH